MEPYRPPSPMDAPIAPDGSSSAPIEADLPVRPGADATPDTGAPQPEASNGGYAPERGGPIGAILNGPGLQAWLDKQAAPSPPPPPDPSGGVPAMRLFSRVMQDLAELTGNRRAATHEEVEHYLGHAIRMERALAPSSPDPIFHPTASAAYASLDDTRPNVMADAREDPQGAIPLQIATPNPRRDDRIGVDTRIDGRQPLDKGKGAGDTAPNPGNIDLPGDAGQTDDHSAYEDVVEGRALQQHLDARTRALLPQAEDPFTLPIPSQTRKTDTDWIIAAKVSARNMGRLSTRDITATPEIRAAASEALPRLEEELAAPVDGRHPRARKEEAMAFGYLMPDGAIEVRLAKGKPGHTEFKDTFTAHPTGPGIPIFGIHWHVPRGSDGMHAPRGSDGMVDAVDLSTPLGDTDSLNAYGIPMATVMDGAIGWHEMIKGQIIFTAPLNAVTRAQADALQSNLDAVQRHFLTRNRRGGSNRSSPSDRPRVQ